MATEKDILWLYGQAESCHPLGKLHRFDAMQEGMRRVLRYLAERSRPVCAGEIAEFMGVSSARVAVLLRKMESRGLITRGKDGLDARRVQVSLSPAGKARTEEAKARLAALTGRIYDRVGRQRLEEFFKVAREIREELERDIDLRERVGSDDTDL